MSAAETIQKYNYESSEVKLAKPSRAIIQEFGKGLLDISSSTINLLMYLSPYVDLDGKINISMEQAKFDMYMQQRTLDLAIREALSYRLLYKKGNDYYSKFHIHTDGNSNDLRYVKLIPAYTSKEVFSYSLRTKRLFYYFLSAKRIGTWHQIHIENLYKNREKNVNIGVNYFDSAKEVLDALLELMENGHIEIELPLKNGLTLNKKTANYEHLLKLYFGYKDDGRKKRITRRESANRVLNVRISNSIIQEDLKVQASANEIKLITAKHGIPFTKIKEKNLGYLIQYKNELFNLIGEAGIAIYRNAIEQYIEKNAFDWLHYNDTDKLANYFMTYHLLEEIKMALLNAAVLQKNLGIGLEKRALLPIRHNYKLDSFQVGALLGYFLANASIQHKIEFDSALAERKVEYKNLIFNEKRWSYLEESVKQEYAYAWNMAQQVIGDSKVPDIHEVQRYVKECVRESISIKKEQLEQMIKRVPMPISEGIAEIPILKVKRVPLYNWLEDRG